jgi:hypothetical protein
VKLVELNPPGQYADDRNLHARQRLWSGQVPSFDIAAWVLDLAGLMPGTRVLINGDVTALPVRDGAFGTRGPCVT